MMWITVVLLGVLCIGGIVFYCIVPKKVDDMAQQSVVMDSTSAARFSVWKSNAPGADGSGVAPLHYDLYVYHVVNPVGASLRGEKLVMEERGPYAFNMYTVQHNVTFPNHGEKIQFVSQSYYVFDEKRTGKGLTANDTFTTVNLAAQAMHAKSPTMVAGAMCAAWKNKAKGYEGLEYTPFVNVGVLDYYFGFKNEPMLTVFEEGIDKLVEKVPSLKSVIPFPLPPPDFPGLGVSNQTTAEDAYLTSGYSVQYTGKGNLKEISEYVTYHNMTEVHKCSRPLPGPIPACPQFNLSWTKAEVYEHGYDPLWNTTEARKVMGTDLQQWARKEDKEEIVGFVDSIYRSAKFTKNVSFKHANHVEGIPVETYGIRTKDLQNASVNPENAAYFMEGCPQGVPVTDKPCLYPQGLFNFTNITGFPFYVSKPHFLDADPALRISIAGIRDADPHLDETVIQKNKFLGTTLRARQALQLNAYLTNLNLQTWSMLNLFEGYPFTPVCRSDQRDQWNGTWNFYLNDSFSGDGLYVPVAYVLKEGKISPGAADKIKIALFLKDTAPKIAIGVGVTLGGIATGLVYFFLV